MIRVLLVDDHTLFRSGISALLASQDDIEVVGEAGEGSEALKLVQTLQPDIMLLDLNMPGLSGLEVLKLTLEDNPQQAVIMLTLSEESDDLLRALQFGAKGYLLKNSDVDYLVNALRLVVQGGTAIHPDMTSCLVAGLRQLKK
nr:response regulator transcription factor [Agitococcus sp.]